MENNTQNLNLDITTIEQDLKNRDINDHDIKLAIEFLLQADKRDKSFINKEVIFLNKQSDL